MNFWEKDFELFSINKHLRELVKITYLFSVKDYGMEDHVFKIVNVNLSEEIKAVKENPEKVKSIDGYPVDYEHYLIIVSYAKHKELYFFKSLGYGLKKYRELRKAIGIRV